MEIKLVWMPTTLSVPALNTDASTPYTGAGPPLIGSPTFTPQTVVVAAAAGWVGVNASVMKLQSSFGTGSAPTAPIAANTANAIPVNSFFLILSILSDKNTLRNPEANLINLIIYMLR